jgi:molecular chaperone IbpA
MKDGLLVINLVREIPEAMKPKKIDIGGSQGQPQHDRIGGEGQPTPASRQTVDADAQNA